MTCLVSWLAVDDRVPSAIYVVTDSRISWGATGNIWDFGRKIYSLKKHPDIFGFAGDVVFASQVLSQVTEAADKGLLFGEKATSEQKFSMVSKQIKKFFELHPKYPVAPEVDIVHCSRDDAGGGNTPKFRCFTLSMRNGSGWVEHECRLPERSDVIISAGSGKDVFERLKVKNNKYYENLSRGIFTTFCDAIGSGLDPRSGGAPQLIALYKEGRAKEFGFINNGRCFYFGMEVPLAVKVSMEWRNDLFERFDPMTMALENKAQRQPRPKEFDLNLEKLRSEMNSR